MKKIFVNLKRFDVPKSLNGICPESDPVKWINDLIKETIALGLGKNEDVSITYFLPEAFLPGALSVLGQYDDAEKKMFSIGCQSVFRDDTAEGGNFGAFTTNRPAAAMCALGCKWTIIGHSEERKDKLEIMAAYDQSIMSDAQAMVKAGAASSALLNRQVKSAIARGMDVVFCIGETAAEKGEGGYSEYAPRVKRVLRAQLEDGLRDIGEKIKDIVIGYEPMWAIGPGKTPADSDYISFVSAYVKEVTSELFGSALDVVYGGGLKEENAKSIAAIDTIDGGLVALTKFTPPIGFDPVSLGEIVKKYTE